MDPRKSNFRILIFEDEKAHLPYCLFNDYWPVWRSCWPEKNRPCQRRPGSSAVSLGTPMWGLVSGLPPLVAGWSPLPRQRTTHACQDLSGLSSLPGPPGHYGSILAGCPGREKIAWVLLVPNIPKKTAPVASSRHFSTFTWPTAQFHMNPI